MRLILLSGLLLSIISWESSLILLLHIQSIRKLDQLHLQTLLWIPFLTPSRAPTLISAHIDCSKLTGNPVSTLATKASSPASRESSSCHCPLLSNLQWLPLPSATASILAVVCMIWPLTTSLSVFPNCLLSAPGEPPGCSSSLCVPQNPACAVPSAWTTPAPHSHRACSRTSARFLLMLHLSKRPSLAIPCKMAPCYSQSPCSALFFCISPITTGPHTVYLLIFLFIIRLLL